MGRFLRLIFPLALGVGVAGVVLVGCQKKVALGTAQSITGLASAGPIVAGTVNVYALKTDGTRGTLLDTEMTDATGTFTLSVAPQSGPVEVSITGGVYLEESQGVYLPMGDHELRLWLPSTANLTSLTVTPLTELAVNRVQKLSRSANLATNIQGVNTLMATAAGLQTILSPPADPTKTLSDPASDAAKYALLLAGISQYAHDHSLADSFEVMDALITDFQNDGMFDGKDGQTPLTFPSTSATVPPSLWQSGLAASMTTFANGSHGTQVGFDPSKSPVLVSNPASLPCSSGQALCGGFCIDVTSDTNNCGSCGAVCNLSQAVAACSSGTCAVSSCQTGFGNCDNTASNGCETSLTTDLSNCGSCGNACPSYSHASAACNNGSCGIGTCSAGYANCDNNPSNGCEISVTSDPQNCGSCGNHCSAQNGTAACVSSNCTIASCNPGYGDCNQLAADGCETSLQFDAANCGSCGNACPSVNNGNAHCTNGNCGYACNFGYADCDANPTNGCEVNTQSNPSHCGSCGHACANGLNCISGNCQ